jgi:predicted glycosyltransferase/CheY-like chemotaxis protein
MPPEAETPRRILIVEDENIVRMHLKLAVQQLGYAVSGLASDSGEALRAAEESAPHLVLMDIRLPGGRDGIETARELKKQHDVAVVFLTAYGDDESIARAQELGAEGYIVKPFSTPQLRATLSSALLERDRRRASSGERPRFASHPGRRAAQRFGAGTRLAIFSHDTLGLGHLHRSMNIARALTSKHPGLSVLLLTGSPAVHRYNLPEGVDYIKLPAVRKVAAEEYQARSLGVSGTGVLEMRTNLILRSLQDYSPDVLLVDHAPVGMKGEMRPALEWLKRHRPGCVKMLGLRDVIDDAEYVRNLWREQGTYQVLEELYDRILVYGTREIYDATKEYAFPSSLAAKTSFCNYVREHRPDGIEAEAAAIATHGRRLVTVTIGGGDGGGETVIGNYLAMLREFRGQIDFESLILSGPFLPADLHTRFTEEIQGLPARLVDFVPSTSPFLARADLVISTCGYNTMTQNLSFARRALIIPRVMHRQEQWIRAKRFADLGFVDCLHPEQTTPERLFERVRAQLADPREPLAEARAEHRIALDATDRIAELCGELEFA